MTTQIYIRFDGLKETIQFVDNAFAGKPELERRVARAIGNDTAKGIRFRLTTRTKKRTGKLYDSVKYNERTKRVEVGGKGSHALALERGQQIIGYRFIPKKGYGKYGEGFLEKALNPELVKGTHTIRPRYFVRDAVASTRQRKAQISVREIQKYLEEKKV